MISLGPYVAACKVTGTQRSIYSKLRCIILTLILRISKRGADQLTNGIKKIKPSSRTIVNNIIITILVKLVNMRLRPSCFIGNIYKRTVMPVEVYGIMHNGVVGYSPEIYHAVFKSLNVICPLQNTAGGIEQKPLVHRRCTIEAR